MTLQDFKKVTEAKVLKYLFSNVAYIALGESKLQKEYFNTYMNVYRFLLLYYHKFGGTYDEVAALDFAKSQGIVHLFKDTQNYCAGIDNITIDLTESAFLAEIEVLISLYKKVEYIQYHQNC